MKDKTYFIIFIVASFVLIIGITLTIFFLLRSKGEEEKDKEKDDWEQYDSYILSIFLASSSCFIKDSENDLCFKRIREINVDNNFIVHGLWPAYIEGKYIDDCNKNEFINITFENKNYTKSLSGLWPGLYSTDQLLWSHEYNKHGYCYIQRIGRNPIYDYEIYFNKTIDIFEKYKFFMEELLPDTAKGLHNVSKNKFKEFLFESSLKLDPSTYSLICYRNHSNNLDVLNEIRFFYNLDFQRINNIKLTENCPDNFQIYFSDERRIPVYEKYDFYIYTVIWNPSSCKKDGKKCYKKVKERELNILMIHGLWPSYSTGRWPQWCNIGEDIHIEEFPKELDYNMTNYWIDISNPNQIFWNHEYNKHGYCYSQYIHQNVSNYTDYFQKAVDLYYHYDLKNLIKEFFPWIFPGERVLDKEYLISKLNEKYGIGRYSMTCIKYEKKFYLYEIRLKLDLEFNLTTKGSTIDNCPEEIYAEILEFEGPQKQDESGFYENYDMYFFTILWLGTTCHIKGEQCYENIKFVPKNIFTLHGLWPSYKNGTLPDWCNGKNDIEIEIHEKNLSEFMNIHYVSGYHTNPYFWGHEYNKHGYCYNQRNNFDVNNYEIFFKKIKDIYLHYDFANIFLDIYKDKINPGNIEINRTEVENYFNLKGFSKDTYLIVCTNITEKNAGEIYPHLLEIRIRFDLDFKLLKNETDTSEFDCPEIFYAQFL